MSFQLKKYTAPDFSKEIFQKAPNVKLVPAPADTVAPEQFHAMSIFPEYFKVDGSGCSQRIAVWTVFRCTGTEKFW